MSSGFPMSSELAYLHALTGCPGRSECGRVPLCSHFDRPLWLRRSEPERRNAHGHPAKSGTNELTLKNKSRLYLCPPVSLAHQPSKNSCRRGTQQPFYNSLTRSSNISSLMLVPGSTMSRIDLLRNRATGCRSCYRHSVHVT